ncbi:MAG: chromate transporter [Bacillota bacterium]|nr:chromate transporter [Bacillota bacterium]
MRTLDDERIEKTTNAEGITLWKMYTAFFCVGLYTVGGAYAMLPVAERMLAGLYHMNEITEAFALAQTLPGVIAANTSAILGHRRRGITGAIVGVLGIITPSIIIISLIAMVFSQIESIDLITKAFAGIRIGVLALLTASAYEMWKKSVKGVWTFLVFIGALAIVVWKVLPAPYVVALAAFLGLLSTLRVFDLRRR